MGAGYVGQVSPLRLSSWAAGLASELSASVVGVLSDGVSFGYSAWLIAFGCLGSLLLAVSRRWVMLPVPCVWAGLCLVCGSMFLVNNRKGLAWNVLSMPAAQAIGMLRGL